MAKINRVLKRRRREGEVPTARIAIRNQCLECVGYGHGEVEQCTDPECWLFPLRFGGKPDTRRNADRDTDGFAARRQRLAEKEHAEPATMAIVAMGRDRTTEPATAP